MISVTEAKNTLFDQAKLLQETLIGESVPLDVALHRTTTEILKASFSVPLFDNSAMDGFALRSQDTLGASLEKPVILPLSGETRAGQTPGVLSTGCIRIMTGAPIPQGADAVIMQEKTRKSTEGIMINEPISVGENIRRQGEDIQAEEVALPSGTRLTPGIIAFLASIGVSEVSVTRKPRISVIITGHELIHRPADLKPGKIFDSNSFFLRAALEEIGLIPQSVSVLDDDIALLKQKLTCAFEKSELILITGGVSVGDHDHTRPLLEEMGVETLFWSVNQKPGKPLYAGRLGCKLIIGLPGNPYSVLTCFTVYVRPLLKDFLGFKPSKEPNGQFPLADRFNKKDDKTYFLKACLNPQGEVDLLKGQGSHQLAALTRTQGLAVIEGQARTLERGEKVEVLFL